MVPYRRMETLLAHQRNDMCNMLRMEREGVSDRGGDGGNLTTLIQTKVGWYGSPVGSGKTRTIAGLVVATRCAEGDHSDHGVPMDNPSWVRQRVTQGDHIHRVVRVPEESVSCCDRSIVVVGLSVLHQWRQDMQAMGLNVLVLNTKREISKFVGHLVSTLAETRELTPPARTDAEVAEGIAYLDKFDCIVLTVNSYSCFTQEMDRPETRSRTGPGESYLSARCAVKFRRIFFDDYGHFSIRAYLPLKTCFAWLVSAVSMPEGSGNDSGIYGNVSWHVPSCRGMGTLSTPFAGLPRYEVRRLLVHTPEHEIGFANVVEHHVRVRPVSRAVGHVIPHVPEQVAAALQCGDIHLAVQMMGGSATQTLMEVATDRLCREMRRVQFRIQEASGRGEETRGMAVLVERRNELQRQVTALEERCESALAEPCAICGDNMQVPAVLSCCNNITCTECILLWERQCSSRRQHARCPFCRSSDYVVIPFRGSGGIGAADDRAGHEGAAGDPGVVGLPSTIEALKSIILEDTRCKILVYSAHDNVPTKIKGLCNELGVKCIVQVSGHSTTRQRLIEEFRKGDCSVMYMDTATQAAGINFPEIGKIVLWDGDRIPENLRMQIVGRGRRLGRREDLHVYTLSTEALRNAPQH